MTPGQRVRITTEWSCFFGQLGSIDRIEAEKFFIVLDDDPRAMAFERSAFEVVVGEQPEPNLTGAE